MTKHEIGLEEDEDELEDWSHYLNRVSAAGFVFALEELSEFESNLDHRTDAVGCRQTKLDQLRLLPI